MPYLRVVEDGGLAGHLIPSQHHRHGYGAVAVDLRRSHPGSPAVKAVPIVFGHRRLQIKTRQRFGLPHQEA